MAHIGRYWVFDWLDENQITSLDQAAAFLPRYKVLDTLRRGAVDAKEKQKAAPSPALSSIVAGTGLDLSGGGMVCSSPQCLRFQVDKLLRHVWHYFDSVVADDVLTPLLTDEWSGSKHELLESILQQLSPLLYLKEIGATELVEFRSKGHCIEHWEINAEIEGLGPLLRSKQSLIERMARRATVSRASEEGQDAYDILFPDAGVGTLIHAQGLNEWQLKCKAAEQAFEMYMVDLVADISASHQYNLPLGSAEFFVGQLLQMSRQPSAAEVMFELELPILQGLPAKELMAIRREHAEYFDNFRNALRVAATERLRATQNSNATRIADEIRMELIQPELVKIQTRLKSAEQLMTKKTSLAIFLGVLATTCSMLAGVPPVVAVPAGVAATLGGVGPAAAKHLETESEVGLNEMYFLWKAVGHAH